MIPNIEFTADINVIGDQGDALIVELIAYVENKGKVQHRMEEFNFDLNADLLQRISDDPDLKQVAKKLGEISVAARIKKDPAYRKTLTDQIAEAEKPETASAVH